MTAMESAAFVLQGSLAGVATASAFVVAWWCGAIFVRLLSRVGVWFRGVFAFLPDDVVLTGFCFFALASALFIFGGVSQLIILTTTT